MATRQVILLFEPKVIHRFWLFDYFPEIVTLPSEVRSPDIDEVKLHSAIQSNMPLPIPADCTDGFAGAYWANLASGAWDARYGHLRSRDQCDLGYRLVVAK